MVELFGRRSKSHILFKQTLRSNLTFWEQTNDVESTSRVTVFAPVTHIKFNESIHIQVNHSYRQHTRDDTEKSLRENRDNPLTYT